MAVVPPFASASLYVGDLLGDVTEANLYEIFSKVGQVASIRICRDAITRRSLGYGYVNFHTQQDAERALDTINNTPIKGRPCRVMWSQRDPSTRKSGRGNIFIKNLDKSIHHKNLYDTFVQFGPITSCKVALDETGESKGFGFIQYATPEAADLAAQSVNGMMLANKKVYVGSFVARKERMQQNLSRKFTNVYVKNLPESVTDAALREMFVSLGNIKSAVVMKDEHEKTKGFGFVNFETPEQAQKAVELMNEKTHDGKTLYVGRAQKKSVREAELKARFEQMKIEQMNKWQGVNLYIKNLDDTFDDSKLRKVFEPYGTITSAKVMFDSAKGVSRGFGFVCFTTPEEATKAVTEMNGKMVDSKPLYVALAQRKEIRRVQLEAQFAQRKQMASRLPAPLAYNGAPMFYAQATGQPGFVTIPQMVAPPPRSRFPGGPYQMPPNYVMMGNNGGAGGSGRGQGMKGGRPGGPGGNPGGPGQGPSGGRSRGMKQNPGTPGAAPTALPGQTATGVPPTSLPTPTTVAIDPASGAMVSVPAVFAPQILATLSLEDQKRAMGDLLYPMIEKLAPSAAAKITGMILESVPIEEMMHLAQTPAALTAKVEEGLKVLRDHAEKQQQQETSTTTSSTNNNNNSNTNVGAPAAQQ